VEYNLGGVWPTCKCGCGRKVSWSHELKGFTTYVKGHYSRVHNNWGHNPEAVRKSAETRRKQFVSGERTVWNIGLTKDTDKRVANNGKRVSKTFTEDRKDRYAEIMRENRLDGTVPTLYGKDASRWKGGVSSVNQIARASTVLYKEWKLPILERDGFKCTQCPNTTDLHVHHDKETFSDIIKKVMTIDDLEHLEEFDRKKEVADRVVDYHIKNNVSGVTLCCDCHGALHPTLNFRQ
jgi:hypothetical protein